MQKSMDNLSTPLDSQHREWEYALSSEDVSHQFLGSFVADIPFGAQQTIRCKLESSGHLVLGNWKLSGIVNTAERISSRSEPTFGVSGNAQLAHPTISQWFNTSVVSAAPAFTYGNQGPYLRGVRTDPIRTSIPLSSKKFHSKCATIAFTGQLRAEHLQYIHRTQFAAPNGTVTGTTLGIVTSQQNNRVRYNLRRKASSSGD